uniref:Uncharacterized protein LOC104232901 n=1 Tax=Nicotiana sylvestris TaxID=4096 RepID=A0A1U7XC28_NICSY|nr:PREDICTED: uncharacterized protein LOC104232901 [Nicotiana sylvestris]
MEKERTKKDKAQSDVHLGSFISSHAIVVALIERWRPEPFAQWRGDYHAAGCGGFWLIGFRPEDEGVSVGASRIALMPVRLHLEAMHDDITYDTPELHINRNTRSLLLLIFGGVLFPNTSENLVSLRFLDHLERLDDLHQYSWGDVVLGNLYRQMCRACMGTQRDVAGFMPLL